MHASHRHTVAIAAVLFVAAAPAQAQQASCHPVSPTNRVVVKTADGASIQGTLLCLTDDAVRLLVDGQATETPLAQIKRIETSADPVWDGAVKGAAIPLVFWALFFHNSDSLPGFLRGAAGYGAIGAIFDSLQTNRKTVYAGTGRSASFAWRVRF
jgi:hypothetical protein